MKKIIIISVLICSPHLVFASGSWTLKEGTNVMHIAGDCSGKEVRFNLYRKGSDDPIYTSGAFCNEGRFDFTDNLLQWESLDDGKYELIVNSDRSRSGNVFIQRPVVAQSVESSTAKDSVVPDQTFLGALVALQQSLLDMRSRLADSDYPDAVKMGLDKAIDGVDALAGKMTDLLFASESGTGGTTDDPTVTPEEDVADIAADQKETVAGSAQAESGGSNGQPAPESGIDAIGLLSTDGLTVDEGSVAEIVENGG
ncbi:MAG: hypothetical protein HGA38_05180 [Candidatus Moranbacteria bacterium]|nr:hypothetical protein [Candidatus Moranbacteria bacterium]